MKNFILIAIVVFGLFSCKKENEETVKPRYCKVCRDKVYLRTDKQPKEVLISDEPRKVCNDKPFNVKATLQVVYDFSDPMHPVYRYETDCLDAVDTTNNNTNNIGG